METTFNDILRILKRAWALILAVAILVGGLAFTMTVANYKPTYRTTAKILAVPIATGMDTSPNHASVSYVYNLLPTFIKLFQVNNVLDEVRLEMNSRGDDIVTVIYDRKSVKGSFSFSYDDDLIINVSCVTSSQRDAVDLMNSMLKHSEDFIENSPYDNIRLEVVENPTSIADVVKVNPPVVSNTVVAGVAGFFLICFVVIMLEMLNTRVKDEKEIMQKYQVPVIGMVPMVSIDKRSKHKKS